MKKVIIREIVNKTCDAWGVKRDDVLGRSRKQPLPIVRVVIAAILRQEALLDVREIGEVLGRDRTTVIYYFQQYESEYSYDASFKKKADAVIKSVKCKSDQRKFFLRIKDKLFGKKKNRNV